MHHFTAKTALLALALVGTAQAHTRFTTLFVDGVNQGDGVCVRMSNDEEPTTDPIEPITNADMACGANGETAVSRVCPAKGSSTLTFEFRAYPDNSEPGMWDPEHMGPCAVYMKKVDSAIASNNAAGHGWFKIYDESYDEAAGKWCTTKMLENNGLLSVKIPDDIQGGYYLVRAELLALHAAADNPPDPQFYVGCAQLFVESSGTTQPAAITIPDNYVSYDMPAMTFDIYATPMALPYPMFGPPSYVSGSAASQGSQGPSTQTEGLKPDGCIMENANWCATEVPSYTDETGCWAASSDCWVKSQSCYDNATPIGSSKCDLWDDKCNHLDDTCNNGIFQGPPDAGTDLTPMPPALDGSMAVFSRLVRKHMRGQLRRHTGRIL